MQRSGVRPSSAPHHKASRSNELRLAFLFGILQRRPLQRKLQRKSERPRATLARDWALLSPLRTHHQRCPPSSTGSPLDETPIPRFTPPSTNPSSSARRQSWFRPRTHHQRRPSSRVNPLDETPIPVRAVQDGTVIPLGRQVQKSGGFLAERPPPLRGPPTPFQTDTPSSAPLGKELRARRPSQSARALVPSPCLPPLTERLVS